jgi:protein-L-isoaspartate(D-aspartate) O-methyltransferase
MPDFAALRRTMVDTQVRPADVTEFPIIDALLRVPRERFVPPGLEGAAYLGENLPLGGGRVMLDPRTLSKMLDALNLTPDDLVLLVGSGTGYSAAVLARLVAAVVAVEEDEAMASDSQPVLAETGSDAVIVEVGPLRAGAPRHGPYDAVLIEGGIERLPDALAAQVREGGRIAALFMEGQHGEVRIGHVGRGGHVDWRPAFNAGAPVLSGFATEAVFRL